MCCSGPQLMAREEGDAEYGIIIKIFSFNIQVLFSLLIVFSHTHYTEGPSSSLLGERKKSILKFFGFSKFLGGTIAHFAPKCLFKVPSVESGREKKILKFKKLPGGSFNIFSNNIFFDKLWGTNWDTAWLPQFLSGQSPPWNTKEIKRKWQGIVFGNCYSIEINNVYLLIFSTPPLPPLKM